MTITETSRLLGVIQAIDNRHVDDLTVTAWHDLLGDVNYPDAYEAVRQHRRSHPDVYLTPGHVLAGAKRIRSTRIADTVIPTPPVPLEPWQDIAFRRAAITAIGDGAPVDAAARIACTAVGIDPRELEAPRTSAPQLGA